MNKLMMGMLLMGALLLTGNIHAEESQPLAGYSDAQKKTASEIDALVQAGNLDEAVKLIQTLIDDQQLPLHDRAIMSLNKAVVLGKMGKSDESIASFDAALAFKDPALEAQILETKAIYLSYIDRTPESIAIYKSLLERPELTADQQARMKENLAQLETSIKP